MRSTRRMQLLKPEVEEIKKKYGSNMQKQQQMTMALYKEHGASPTAGCLPMLVQMPILFALFDTIRHFGEAGSGHPIYPEYFNFWIWEDLSVIVADGALPFLLPILAAGATFLQQFLMSTNRKDRTQRIMLIAFPLIFLIIVRNFPILMAFYWIFYSLIGAIIMVPITRRWHKIDHAEIEVFDGKKATMIRLGVKEDFEDQPLPMTSTYIVLTKGFWQSDFQITRKTAYSGQPPVLAVSF